MYSNYRTQKSTNLFLTKNCLKQKSNKKKIRQTVVSPIIDVISDDNFAYLSGSEVTYGGFSDKMIFRWIPMPEREHRRRHGDKSLPARFVFNSLSLSTK